MISAVLPTAHAQVGATATTLCNFIDDSDGGHPAPALIKGSDGNFYGTTSTGGANGEGTIFQYTPAGVLTTIHSFSNSDGGEGPSALVEGSDGNFYGTFGLGGANNNGSVFRMTPAGVLTTLYNFRGSGSVSGPSALVEGNDGNFYGTIYNGGVNGVGSVYQITPAGGFTPLHDFSSSEGEGPSALVKGSDGNFYGTTYIGGANNGGMVFRITPAGGFTTLYSFNFGGDGTDPDAALVEGSDGNFYGTTSENPDIGAGTVFQITPTGVLKTLYSFTGESDGGSSNVALIEGSDGNFYGKTSTGGANGDGTIFQITPAGGFTTLLNLTVKYNSGLVEGSNGNFYGTTYTGGVSNDGTIYELSVTPLAAPVITDIPVLPAQVGQAFSFQIVATNSPTSFAAGSVYSSTSGLSEPLPDGLSLDPATGVISGTPTREGDFVVAFQASNAAGAGLKEVPLTIATSAGFIHPSFFTGEQPLSNRVYYLKFFYFGSPNGYFSYYSYLSDPHYIYHFDLGYEYVFDAEDGYNGVYLYDFTSNDFFYTSPVFPFPYLYDFGLNSTVYYYPDPNDSTRYDTNGIRYFYVFSTGQVISK